MLNDSLLEMIVALINKKPGKEDITLDELKDSIEKAALRVSRYCRLRTMPEELKYILADMASDVYDMDHFKPTATESDDDFSGRVKSLKQGDTTIELETVEEKAPFYSMSEIMEKYYSDLVPYRGIFWR